MTPDQFARMLAGADVIAGRTQLPFDQLPVEERERLREAARRLLDTAVAAAGPAPATDQAALTTFVLWLDASDGSVPSCDGVVWPDGTATVHHRNFGHTATHANADAARHAAHGKQGRIVWPAPHATDQAADLAKHVTRAIFALKTPSPDGSQHYRSGWDDGLEAAMGAARDAVLDAPAAPVLPAPVDPAAVLNRATQTLLTDIGLRETEGEHALAEYGRELVGLLRGLANADAARHAAHGKQGRIAWSAPHATDRAAPERRRATCPDREPLLGVQCAKETGHEVHSDRPGRIWYPAPDNPAAGGTSGSLESSAASSRQSAFALNPAVRAAALREAADRQTQLAVADDLARRRDVAAVRRQFVRELRRMADETPQPETCTNCRGSGLDPRDSTGGSDCPDCPPAVAQPDEEADRG